ncbi:MAG: sigma-54-dependent Fis family transcriptional regulator [Candidatus Neomarinimicrobiota bacterium]|nr:MAG: sigma-54-dependent Fis family transcriptional regulator [Candidatus Neomarinimicrobiota bacterium]
MKILIVDDERNIRLTLKDILGDEGFECKTVPSGEKALAYLAEERVDMMILDVRLPGMDGLEVLEKTLQLEPDLDVLMISGHGTIETAVEAVKRGAYDFLEKPLSMAKVLTAVRNIREKRTLQWKVREEQDREELQYRLVGHSDVMETLRATIRQVAPTDSKVLITGESGTGKELVAQALVSQSQRKGQPFIKFNSAAIPAELVESELFGHEKGAFTGATTRKIGKLERANHGTLFLDEIGDMGLSAQAKILRVIQEGTFERVGGNKTLTIQTRVIAATHKDLEAMVREGTFREDLYYRLNVIPIHIPPLRDHLEDIPDLVDHFQLLFSHQYNFPPKSFSPGALRLLQSYTYPGNVRELKNLLERCSILLPAREITREMLRPFLPAADEVVSSLRSQLTFREAKREFERQFLRTQLQRYDWNISLAARQLGMHQPNLSRKIKELGIEPE